MRRIVTASTVLLLGIGACSDTLTSPTDLQEEIAAPAAVRANSNGDPISEPTLQPGETETVTITAIVPSPLPPLPPGSDPLSLRLSVSPGDNWIHSVVPEVPKNVDAGETVSFTIKVSPPVGTLGGTYQIGIAIILEPFQTQVAPYKTVTIVVPDPAQFDPPDFTKTLPAGENEPQNIKVEISSSALPGDLTLQVCAGYDWLQSVDPEGSISVMPGQTYDFTMVVGPPDNTGAGTYDFDICAVVAGSVWGRQHVTITVEEASTSPLDVAIDIKPGSDPNSINLGSKGNGNGKAANSNANIAVALFSTDDFDATLVDVSTVTLGDLTEDDTPVVVKRNGTFQASEEDVNGDGLMDMVFHFSRATLIGNGDLTDTSVSLHLTGIYVDGRDIEGVDDVRVIN